MKYSINDIYEMVPPFSRERYGSTKEEVAINYMNEHYEFFIDSNDIDSLLDFIVRRLVIDVGDFIALKGGYVVKQLHPLARYTTDVDLSIEDITSFTLVLKSLEASAKKIIDVFGGSYSLTDVKELSSGGVTVYKNLLGEGKQSLVSVDVSLQNLSYGVVKVDNLGRRFTIERMLADKLSALSSYKRLRRSKDLYDLWLFNEYFSIDYKELLRVVNLRGYNPRLFTEEELIQMNKAYDTLKLDRSKGTMAKDSVPYRLALAAYGTVILKLEEAKNA
jgi:hypothetical protein